MTWEEAIKKIIRQYYEEDIYGTEYEMDKIKKTKYNKAYFDTFAEEMGIGQTPKSKNPVTKK